MRTLQKTDAKWGRFFYLSVVAFFLSLSWANKIDAQTIEEQFDLRFQSVQAGYGWSWLVQSHNASYSLDTTSTFNDRFPLKITHLSQQKGIPTSSSRYREDKMSFTLARTIILPPHEGKENGLITLSSKGDVDSLLLQVAALDGEENLTCLDSIYVRRSNDWSDTSIPFPASKARAIKIIIKNSGRGGPDEKIYLGGIQINTGTRSLNSCIISSISEKVDRLRKRLMTPLSLSDVTSFFKIKAWRNKKIIALGKSTYGSQEIEDATYLAAKHLISRENCKIVLLEKPMDMCLRWDLYVNNLLSDSYENELIDELKGFFNNYQTTFHFLKWLRTYNKKNNACIRLFGIDNPIDVPVFLADYFLKTATSKNDSTSYLQAIADEQYLQVREYVSKNTRLNTIDKDYLLFTIDEWNASMRGSYAEQRNFRMSERVNKIICLYLYHKAKAVILAHTELTNKGSVFTKSNDNLLSLGHYLYNQYKGQYFSIAFQAGVGSYTQDSLNYVGRVKTEKLVYPPPYSLEYSCLQADFDCFYYPVHKLPNAILSLRVIPRASRNQESLKFCYLPKRFDAFVFIRQSNELKAIEVFSAFKLDNYVGRKRFQVENSLKGLRE